MSKALDTGDIIYQKAINLSPDETYTSLYQRLCSLAYDILGEKIDTLFNINLVTKKQDESQATYAKNISRTDELIDWNKPANKVDAKIRGLYEQPIAYSVYQNYNVKIHQAKLTTNQSSLTPGAISKIDGSGIYVATNSNDICLTKIQLPGKRPITIKELLNGNHPFKVNSKFTS
jgi:methionyl-tRNA formyltransferase